MKRKNKIPFQKRMKEKSRRITEIKEIKSARKIDFNVFFIVKH